MHGSSTQRSRRAALVLLVSSVGLLGLTQAPSQAAESSGPGGYGYGGGKHFVVKTKLGALNNSGVTGRAKAKVKGHKVTISVNAKGLLEKAPHAMHFHFSKAAAHVCPTVANDTNADHRLATLEGAPAYGGVKYSLTTSGDTSASSALAVDRFPTANTGKIRYDRTFKVTTSFAKKIKHGKVAVVIHGIDYNQNGMYDADAGPSDLNPALPAEATDPVACGILS